MVQWRFEIIYFVWLLGSYRDLGMSVPCDLFVGALCTACAFLLGEDHRPFQRCKAVVYWLCMEKGALLM